MTEAMRLAELTVAELLRQGTREAVLAPGSRSGPLALALHAADDRGLLRLHVRVDEREAAFLALGLARAGGRPVPVVTTSGSAVANLHPAFLEAWHQRVGIIALTADRPAHLRGTGANQTTDQRGLLAPVPTCESLEQINWSEPGPWHLNLAFAEPLIAERDWDFSYNAVAAPAGDSAQARTLESGPRTVVVAGDTADSDIASIAKEAGWPILAEPSSGLRGAPTAVATGRLLLANTALADRIERVVSVGHTTLSRPFNRLLARTDIPIVHVGDQHTFPVSANENVEFVEAVRPVADDQAWLAEWLTADEALTAALPADDALQIARTVWDYASESGAVLTLGPSQIARDVDLAARARTPAPQVFANRGLAGIDGILSTAIGASLGLDRPGVSIVGDLTFLHGSNGLLIGPQEPRPELTIVVVNDDGGAIFSTLEQGAQQYAQAFERVYGTPTGADLEQLCGAFQIPYELTAVDELRTALEVPYAGVRVLEVRLDRTMRRAQAARLNELVTRIL